MTSTSGSAAGQYSQCKPGDTLCEIRVYEQEVIVVPLLLLVTFTVTLVLLLLLRFCPEKVRSLRPKNAHGAKTKRVLHGIDAPLGLNVLEGESIALDDTPSYFTFSTSTSAPHRPGQASHGVHNLAFIADGGSFGGGPLLSDQWDAPRQRLPEKFKLVTSLPCSYSLKSDHVVSLYRARMENRNVVLRVLNDSASSSESQSFLGFASFLSQLGPHPFLPELIGVVSLRAPLIIVVEEMENQDLLGFLWRCRQAVAGPDAQELTEKRIFTMASQVASALEYLHSKDIVHSNVKARSVLVSRMLTAKLWGLGGVYGRKTQTPSYRDDPGMRKWQAPEVLANKPASPRSDVWSFGLLLYEMATLGEVPFAEIPVNELLQYLQRGKSLKKPNNCSNTLHSIIKGCCQWKEQDRTLLAEISRKLQSGEKGANDKAVLRAPGPIKVEQYLQQAGYGDFNDYTVF
ncbi:tyrosine-protein kinase STYK1b [Electrophorus electricus]|uniref:Protein kinase domain-containing protein n=1 Tax=Electrophorus electricus TaxID=8005 RepID=A0A4W4HIA6_ELEEL|nr:tyrosine-protein kinase STYK1b [Electrophorus electricus]